jgi:hypothetical protein
VALTVLLPFAALAALIGAIAAFNRASVMDDISNRLFTNDIQDADDAVGAAAGFFLLAALAIAVVFIIWQYRHAKNAERLAGSLPLGPGWAIGGWFIPLGNYVLPELQLYRAAAASDPDAPPRSGRAPGVVIVWWVLFAAAGLLAGVGRAIHPSDSDVTLRNLTDKADQFATADRVAGIGLLLMIPAAIAAIVMVRQLTARQEVALSRAPSATPYQQPYQQGYQQPYQQPQPWQPPPQPQAPQPWQQPPPPPAPPPPAPPPPPSSPSAF